MIKQYNIKSNDTTYLRLWQKIQFGKEILPEGLFDVSNIENTSHCYRLNVFQLDKDTRVFYLGRVLYAVNSADQIYNYLDTGRAVKFDTGYHYSESEPQKAKMYIFNDLIITDKDIENFEDYPDKDSFQLKLILKTDTEEVYLIYSEDLQKIKAEMEALKRERDLEKQQEKKEELENKQKADSLLKELKNYDKLNGVEDDNAIIFGNYFIDKQAGIKIEFTEDIIKLFKREDILKTYNIEINDFIQLGYSEFFYKLESLYEISIYRDSVVDKLKDFNKKLLNFKVYSYDIETKQEVFLKEIKIENIYKEQKIRYEINDIKIPKNKMSKVFEFLRKTAEPSIIKDRIINFEKIDGIIFIYKFLDGGLQNAIISQRIRRRTYK